MSHSISIENVAAPYQFNITFCLSFAMKYQNRKLHKLLLFGWFFVFFFLIRFFGWFRTLFHRKRKKIHKTLLQINSCSTIFFFSVHHLHSNRFHLVQLHNNSLCIKKMIGKWFCSKAAEVKPKEKTQTERKNRKTEKRKKKTQLQNIGIGLSLIKQKYYDAHVR